MKVNAAKNPDDVSPESPRPAHAPLPWDVGETEDGLWIEGKDKAAPIICDLIPRDADSFTLEDEANAEFIVRAVNAHNQLVAALRYIRYGLAMNYNKEMLIEGIDNVLLALAEGDPKSSGRAGYKTL